MRFPRRLRRSGFIDRSSPFSRAAVTTLIAALLAAPFPGRIDGRNLLPAPRTASADTFAQNTLNALIASLQQEIAQGSTASTAGTATIYQPLTPANMLPVRSGNPPPAGSPAVDPVPNLIRRSVRADAIAAPGVPSLASAVNSAADPALNGSAVTPARWNLHYLLPRFDAEGNPGVAASTPDAAAQFTSPDWVLVSRSGPAVQTGIGTGANALNNPDAGNANYVVGRYAFAMYDEGGLLDINAAGYPTPTLPAAVTGFTPTQVGFKGLLAFADLTCLPIVRSPASTADYLPQTSVDRLVGWRNYASAKPDGAYPDYTFDAAAAARYYNAVLANRSGFLSVDPTVQFNGQTDQRFTSRQQLIGLCGALGISRNALQYLTTFSRALEQPSYTPAHLLNPNSAPAINTVGSTAPPAGSSVDSYLGNNDAAGSAGSVAGQDLINPALLTVRVQSAFTRQDGSTAVVGEPLVKKKFALGRLAEVTYSATDTTASVTDPTAAHNHIKDWFGLSRTNASAPWTYSHGSARILTLAEVAAAGREPDFAELLKAAINAGSLAKGGPNLHNSQGNYQYTLDTSVDYQVIELMANLIDQYDADSYPTVIQYAVGNTNRTVRGVEDLPYFYRVRQLDIVTRLPSPLLPKATQVTWKTVSGGTTVTTTSNCEPLPAGGLADAGQAVFLYAPEIWNPHDADPAVGGSSGGRPVRFRVVAVTDDPLGATPSWSTGVTTAVNGSYYSDIPPTASIPMSSAALTEASTAFTFSDDSGKLFREPTLLWRADAPTNSNLAADTGSLAGPYTDANTGVAYFGLQIGQVPVSFVGTVDNNKYTGTPSSPTSQYLFQASNLQVIQQVPAGAYSQYTFRLQYLDPNGSGTWITYDEKYPDFHGLYRPNLVVNKLDYSLNQWMNPVSTGQLSDCASAADPRAARFGVATETSLTYSGKPVLEADAAANYGVNTAAGNAAFAASKFTVYVTDRPGPDHGNQTNYTMSGMTSDPGKNVQMRWFSGVGFSASNGQSTAPLYYDGLLTQNNPAAVTTARNGTTPAEVYYEDADGVARRAMGAYADTSLSTSGAPQGLPEVTANTYPSGSYGVGTPTAQSESRPLVLNRPFRSVAEMGYAFSGSVWKNVDFFTPESGDAALLDTFCLTEPPAGALVGGKVNLNTRQAPVLQAILSGAYRDELNNRAIVPAFALPALNATEAANPAAKLVAITTDTTAVWRGPLVSVADLVGHFVAQPGSTSGAADVYQFAEPVTGQTYTYAGLSAALDATVYTGAPTTTPRIQRLRESAIRPLADCGQTRVWNILIDVVVQTGDYPADATNLGQFAVTEENHYWLHVAIDRFTGQVLDESVEPVYEGVTGLTLSAAAVPENQPAGTIVGTLQPTDANPGDAVTYSLATGAGGDDNASFTVSGNSLVTAGTFQYLTRSSYSVRLRAANAQGQGFERAFAITVSPGRYTQWKVDHFGAAATDPAVAGDSADPDHDGLANLVEYALGTSPTSGNGSGITARVNNGTLTMNYTRASSATDVTAQAYYSTNLTDPTAWTHSGVTETMLSDDGTLQQWQATVPAGGGRAIFLRLQISQP